MQNKREQSIVSSVLKRNDNSSRNPLDRTFEKYKLDRNKLDESFRLSDFEDTIAQKVADAIHKNELNNVQQGTNKEYNNTFESDELTSFYTDELKDVIKEVRTMSRTQLSTQLARMGSLMETLADSDVAEQKFLMQEYAKSVTFLEDEYKRKSNVMMRTQTFMGNLASEYLDVQSLYAGFVDHNPLAMGLFKLGKTALDTHREGKADRKMLVENDIHRQVQAKDTEQRKAAHLAEEQKRANELHEANVKAGNTTEENTNDNVDSKKDSSKSGVSRDSKDAVQELAQNIPQNAGMANQDVESQIREKQLKKDEFDLLKRTTTDTSKWQKEVLVKLNKIQRTGRLSRRGGKGGLGVGAGATSILGGGLNTAKTAMVAMGGAITATAMKGVVGAGLATTVGGVLVSGTVGAAIGTAISKGYEHARGGKSSIGSDIYDLVNDDATVQSIEKRGIIDRDWLGDSELDRTRLKELGADELKALLNLKDFDKEDTKAIVAELKKKTDERLKRIQKGNKLRRDRENEQIMAMTPEQRVRNIGYDPVQRDKANAEYMKNRMANKDKPLDMNYVPKTIDVDQALRQGGQRGKFFDNQNEMKSRRTGVQDTKQQVYEALTQKGLPEHMKQAIMMNMQDESGFKSDITESVANKHGTFGKGLYQLTGSRRDDFESKYGNDYSINNQIDHMMNEFQTTEKNAYNQMMASDSSGEAGKVMVEKFLRPAKQHQIHRGNKYMNSSDTFYTNNSKSKDVKTVQNATIPVQNDGERKVEHIKKSDDIIQERKQNEGKQPVVVTQNTNTTQGASSGGTSESPMVGSARNSDSSLQRITDRSLSFSMV